MTVIKPSKKIIVVVVVALIVLILGAIWLTSKKNTVIKTTITEGTAVKGNLDVFIEADGTASVEKANINFSQTGTIHDIKVKLGDLVSKGDRLATIESGKLQYQVDQARAAYDVAVARAGRLKVGTGEEINAKGAAVTAAKLALVAETNIYKDVLHDSGRGSSQELAEKMKLKNAESDVSIAEAQFSLTAATSTDAELAVTSALANLDSAELALSEVNLKSPIDGVVTSINGLEGQSTGGTQQSTDSLIVVSKLDNIFINSYLDEEDITKIKVDQTVEAEFAALGKIITGKVTYVAPVAVTDSNGSVTYEVKISFINDGSIIDGMSAGLKFITKSVQNVVKIPNKAVKMVNGKSTVSYYDLSKNLVTKDISTGFTDGLYVEVMSGLSAGDKFVVVETK